MTTTTGVHDRMRAAADDYLAMRRALGFKLVGTDRLLVQFIDHLQQAGVATITTEAAVAWATQPVGVQPAWWRTRLQTVRQFAIYLQTLDPTVEIPPVKLLPHATARAVPFIYTHQQILALLEAAGRLRPMTAATYTTLIGLLSVTGMRVGEVIGLDLDDLDRDRELLTVRRSKFGKSRQLPLHPTTTAQLTSYLRTVDRRVPDRRTPALLVSTAGTRLFYSNVHLRFQQLTRTAGIHPVTSGCRPRLHDLRHTFAVDTLVGWQRDGDDVQARLPWLSTYLGHTDPGSTYWYLSATPELLGAAAERLDGQDRP